MISSAKIIKYVQFRRQDTYPGRTFELLKTNKDTWQCLLEDNNGNWMLAQRGQVKVINV